MLSSVHKKSGLLIQFITLAVLLHLLKSSVSACFICLSILLSVSHYLSLQRAGPGGVAGQHAVRNVAAESRSAAEAVSPRTACARAQLKKDGPVTLSPVLVSPPGMELFSWGHSAAGG